MESRLLGRDSLLAEYRDVVPYPFFRFIFLNV